MQSALVEHYSSKTDDELLALAADPGSLVEEAQSVLANELLRRNLAVPTPTSTKSQSPHVGNRPVANFFRTVGSLLLNLAIAIFGTASIESFIWSRMGSSRSMFEIEIRAWLFSVTIAALLGFIVYKRWPNKAAMWVWVLPVLLLTFRVLLYATHKSDTSVWEHFIAPDCTNGRYECQDFLIFTVIATRTIVYSLVVWVSWRLQNWPNKTDSPQA